MTKEQMVAWVTTQMAAKDQEIAELSSKVAAKKTASKQAAEPLPVTTTFVPELVDAVKFRKSDKSLRSALFLTFRTFVKDGNPDGGHLKDDIVEIEHNVWTNGGTRFLTVVSIYHDIQPDILSGVPTIFQCRYDMAEVDPAKLPASLIKS